MKNKLVKLLIIGSVALAITGCNKATVDTKTENSTKTESVSETSSKYRKDAEGTEAVSDKNILIDADAEEINTEDMKYYNNISIYMSDYYTTYEKLGDAIDANDDDMFNSYLKKLQDETKKVKEMEVPDKFKDGHEYFINALNEYEEGVTLLKSSYKDVSNDTYNNANEKLAKGAEDMQIFITYVEEYFKEFADYLESFYTLENYLSNINIYNYDANFDADENEFLFFLSRYTMRIVNAREDIFEYALNKDEEKAEEAFTQFSADIDAIDNLSILDENLSQYKDITFQVLDQYRSYTKTFYKAALGNDLSNKVFEVTSNITSLSSSIYQNFSYISDFYESKGIDIGYNAEVENNQEETESTENTDDGKIIGMSGSAEQEGEVIDTQGTTNNGALPYQLSNEGEVINDGATNSGVEEVEPDEEMLQGTEDMVGNLGEPTELTEEEAVKLNKENGL